MQTKDFEKKLKELDSRLSIVENPNRPGLSNIKLDGRDICPVPSGEIKEEADPTYFYTFPNGAQGRHKSQKEALAMVEHTIEFIKTDEGKATFYED